MDFSISRSRQLRALFSSTKKLIGRAKNAPFWTRLATLSIVFLISWLLICQRALHHHSKLRSFSKDITTLERKAHHLEKQKMIQRQIQQMQHQAYRDYLAQVVEPLPLLQQERERVASLTKQFPDNFSLKERLLFLDSDQNRIRFEQDLNRSGQYTECRFAHVVQMDLSNLRKFLEAVEGDRYDASQGKPLLLMKKFDLRKCYEKGDEKVYSIDVELLQK
jgi:hypothetical protein